MTTNWKRLVQQANAETFRLPEGWTAREKVAEQLGCSVERVGDAMRPLLSCKPPRAEAKTFDVWDEGLERKVRVMAYRELAVKAASVASVANPADRASAIRELRSRGQSWAFIARSVGCSKTNVQRIAKQHGVT